MRSVIHSCWRLATGIAFVLCTCVVAVASGVQAEPADIQRAIDAGLRAFYIRDFAHAVDQFELALRIAPQDPFALAFLVSARANLPGGLQAEIEADRNAVAVQRDDVSAQLRLAFAELAATATGADRAAGARAALDAVLARDRGCGAAHDGMGILYVAERNPMQAKSEFLAALGADANDPLAREYLSELYQIDLKDPQRALAYAIAIPNLQPEYPDILFHLASIFDDLHQPRAAVDYARRGLALDVGNVGEAGRHGRTLLARIYLRQGRIDDARRELRAAIAAQVDVTSARTLLQTLATDAKTSSPFMDATR